MQKRWSIRKHDFEAVRSLAAELNVSPLMSALLIARGYGEANKALKFVDPHNVDLHEPYLMLGMRDAVERVLSAISRSEKILIWGDYDVDGTTGTVLLRKAISLIGGETGFHVPNRFTEGYGLNIPELERAKNEGYLLVITVDCGIRAFEPLEWARDAGLDVIVTDHHLSDESKGNPPAFSVVNPNQPGCEYPDKNLAGAGVAFKLAHALLREKGKEDLVRSFLKIAAIGTVADVMKLTGENRAIVAQGLRDLPNTTNHGLKALMEVADCRSGMTSYDIGFRIAPRINAAGRMDVARHVVELFESKDFGEARRFAAILDSRNRERQKVQQEITEQALLEASRGDRPRFVVVSGENWHKGVIGLAASRIAERLYRPTIVLSVKDGMAQGSGRTVGGFHLLQALESCSELFEQFGGHAAAAGMTMKADRIDHLRDALNLYAAEITNGVELSPELKIDALVRSETLSLSMLDELKKLEPFGHGNPKPVFATRGLLITDEPLIMKERHLKFRLADAYGKRFEAVWWSGVEKLEGRTFRPETSIEIAYTPEVNEWQGTRRLQLVVEDLREEINVGY